MVKQGFEGRSRRNRSPRWCQRHPKSLVAMVWAAQQRREGVVKETHKTHRIGRFNGILLKTDRFNGSDGSKLQFRFSGESDRTWCRFSEPAGPDHGPSPPATAPARSRSGCSLRSTPARYTFEGVVCLFVGEHCHHRGDEVPGGP
ncbi:hypothetical protein CRG98_042231 [Punica granatum]|uniref:Uncharacterized protein n=1 Tax=Punica granatum TaxID=22663 RepID=A0A2I0I053_PUNGR|nr:hypothetical protein CRG98_042231 [Punica granatum]